MGAALLPDAAGRGRGGGGRGARAVPRSAQRALGLRGAGRVLDRSARRRLGSSLRAFVIADY